MGMADDQKVAARFRRSADDNGGGNSMLSLLMLLLLEAKVGGLRAEMEVDGEDKTLSDEASEDESTVRTTAKKD